MNFIFSAIRNIIIGITLGVSLSFAMMNTRALSGWPSINPAVPTITSSGGFLMTEFEKILVDTSVTTDGKVKQTKNLDGLPLASYQKRITGSCSASNPIVEIKTDGSVVCLDKVVVDTCAIAPDITLPNGQVWQACNIGATSTIPTDVRSYGNYYQWGRNNTGFTLPAKGLAGYDWQDHNDNAWGDTTNTEIARQGPCSVGYHVPTRTEWSQVNTQGLVNTLKLPKAGSNQYAGLPPYTGPVPSGHGISGHYWSSTPYPGSPGYFDVAYNFDNSGALINGNARAIAFPVRCIKNTVPVGGNLYCWGNNSLNALGISVASTTIPNIVLGGPSNFTKIAVGGWDQCGITEDSKTYCWGRNRSGVVGDGTKLSNPNAVTTPKLLPGYQFVDIGVGIEYACGLMNSGAVFCWGNGSDGRLGYGGTSEQLSPRKVDFSGNFVQLSVGGIYSCALTSTGSAFCWGRNTSGQLGDGTTNSSLRPQRVISPAGVEFKKIVASNENSPTSTCALSLSGSAYCWGDNNYDGGGYGNLGIGYSVDSGDEDILVPTLVQGGHAFIDITSEGSAFCGRKSNGTTYCWGNGTQGLLGNGTYASSLIPVLVNGGYDFPFIFGSEGTMWGITGGGDLYSWGNTINSAGMRSVPAKQNGINPVKQVDSSGNTACAVMGTPTPLPPIIPSTNVCTLDATLDCVLPM